MILQSLFPPFYCEVSNATVGVTPLLFKAFSFAISLFYGFFLLFMRLLDLIVLLFVTL